jgi:acetyl-CoA C-acetyltransferase
MGDAADHSATKFKISRAEQDRFAAQSHQRAARAWKECWFKAEIAPLAADQLGGGAKEGVAQDEGIRADSTAEGLGKLRPAFAKDGTVTAGNASQISDGAAAVLVASEAKAKELGIAPIAKIVDYCTAGVAPKDIFDAPTHGLRMIMERNKLTPKDVDLFEVNEAFAAQVLTNITQLGIPEDKVNIAGGAIAIGHPIGGSGARVLTTLLHQMKRTNASRGIASLCLGGGNAVSMLVERM